MKKVISLVLLALALFSFCGCAKNEGKLKIGQGVYVEAEKAKDAEGDRNGTAGATVTIATVLIDENGKIAKCILDSAEYSFSYTSEGKALEPDTDFKTKREQGDAYGMKLYGGAAKEWYEQADAFCAVAEGKSIGEIKALLADGGKGNGEVISAGCTISVEEFIFAIEKAVANASSAK